jgi:DNA-binding SARP family transcriptional activator
LRGLALLVYQRTRQALADALGVDPSPELSALRVALLRGELGRREENRKTNLRAELTSSRRRTARRTPGQATRSVQLTAYQPQPDGAQRERRPPHLRRGGS